jgi:hypothetical protein
MMTSKVGPKRDKEEPEDGENYTERRLLNLIERTKKMQPEFIIPMFLNSLNAELNPICYLLALLGAHHFLHVSRIRVKSLSLRLLMSYIYMECIFLMFLDHTQRRSTVGRTPLDE